MTFTWDPRKNQRNIIKHKIDFNKLPAVFESSFTKKDIYDRIHSIFEHRYYAIGYLNYRKIKICYTYRGENTIRIISAFKVKKGR